MRDVIPSVGLDLYLNLGSSLYALKKSRKARKVLGWNLSRTPNRSKQRVCLVVVPRPITTVAYNKLGFITVMSECMD